MDKKIKVAFLSYYSGIHQRGVESTIFELANRFSPKIDLTLFQAGNNKQNLNLKTIIYKDTNSKIFDNKMNIRKRLFIDNESLKIRKFSLWAKKIINENNFDIVVPWNNGWQTLIFNINKKWKTVCVGQSGIGWDDRINLYLNPDAFIALTLYQKKWAKKINPFLKNIVVIPNGVDTKRFIPKGVIKKIDLPKPIILSVGALVKAKRHDLTIQAFSKIFNASLLIVGKGPEKANLELLIKNLNLSDRVKIIDTNFTSIDTIYRACDLFTYPVIKNESFGIVLLEAMASNLKIVANDDPIRREIVGKNGFFVNPQKLNLYKETINKALEANLKNIMRNESLKYSWDKVAQKYENVFSNLL